MKKSLQLAALASLAALAGCAVQAQEEEVGTSSEAACTQTSLGSYCGTGGTTSLPNYDFTKLKQSYSSEGGGDFDPRDGLLSALGSATLDCLGTVDPSAYDTSTGMLRRTFKECQKGAEGKLKEIDALLGVQNSKHGQKDELGKHYTVTWDKYRDGFPSEIKVCPQWKKIGVINAPNKDNVLKQVGANYGKTNYDYEVRSEQCGKNGECAVKHAMACAGGFGSQFLVAGDPKASTVLVDPTWWLLNDLYENDSDNPFMQPGYFHGMSYYGRLPGDRYGALAREGERCSKYDPYSGKHYDNHYLYAIDCGYGWYCMTYCM